MIDVLKADCVFHVQEHAKIKSYTCFRKQITIAYGTEKYLVTNAGNIKSDKSWVCAKSFWPQQAKNFIENLPECITLETL